MSCRRRNGRAYGRVSRQPLGWPFVGEATMSDARRRRYVLITTMIGVAAVSFPNSLVTSALPLIAKDFNARTSVMAWVTIAPAIVFSVSMPLFGKVGDLYGHRRVFITGFAASTVLAVATSLAPNVGALIVMRTAAQLCGTSTIPSSFAMLALVYPPAERPGAFGRVSAVLAASPVVAIIFGAPMVEAIGWRPVFVVQAIPAAITVIVASRLLPETSRRPDVRFDVPGAATLAVGLSGVLLAVNRLDEWGFSVGVMASLATGILGLMFLVAIERRSREPLFPCDLFRRPNFLAPVATMGVTQAGFVGSAPLTAYLLGQRFGYSTLGIALVSAARPGAFSVASALANRCAQWLGGRWVQLVGNLITAGSGVAGMLSVSAHSVALVVVSSLASGFGVGFARPGIVTAINNAVASEDVGIANGVNNMAGQIGSSIGTTIALAFIGTSAASRGVCVCVFDDGDIRAACRAVRPDDYPPTACPHRT